MMQSWLDYLTRAGAVMEQGVIRHFGHPQRELAALKNATLLTDLSTLAVLSISGEDAQVFLQGQFTNDVRLSSPHQAQYSGHCTPKGRLLATFLLWQEPDNSYRLQLPASMLDGFRKRLGMYVLRSKAVLADASQSSVRLGLAGKDAPELAARLFGAVPETALGIVRNERGALLRLGPQRFEILCQPEQAINTWEALSKDCTPAAPAAWDWLDIQAGIALIQPETREEFVPQMVNFETLGGVSFKKGCYTGQEIVARAQHIGQVKRRMYRAHGEASVLPQPGDTVWHAGVGDSSSEGKVVSAAPSPDGGVDLLMVVATSAAEAGELRLANAEGALLELSPLTY